MRDDDLQQLARQYSSMTDAELLHACAGCNDIVEPAQKLLHAEFARRHLTPPPISADYAKMSVRDLMRSARGYNQLSQADQARLRDEFKSRALLPPLLDADGEPEPELPSDDLTLVTVGQYRDLSEAIVARAVLEEAGITCLLRDENTVRMDWLWSNLIGGLRLQVEEKDAAAAEALLAEPTPAAFPVDSGQDFQQPVCPTCGSVDVVANDSDRKVLAASMFIGLPLPHRRPPPNSWKCNHCGTRWQDDGQPGEHPTAEAPTS
jgi:hypothetical protein